MPTNTAQLFHPAEDEPDMNRKPLASAGCE